MHWASGNERPRYSQRDRSFPGTVWRHQKLLSGRLNSRQTPILKILEETVQLFLYLYLRERKRERRGRGRELTKRKVTIGKKTMKQKKRKDGNI